MGTTAVRSLLRWSCSHPITSGLAGLTLAVLTALHWPLDPALLAAGRVVSVRVEDREGGLLREVRPAGRGVPLRLADVPPAVLEALVAVEDRRFWAHPGVDPLALARAAAQNARAGRVVSGGSTLSMQVARTLRARQGRGLGDKLAEAWLALRLERQRSKAQILRLWLERVPFGNQTFGLEAAAELYFGKAVRDLTLAEAAYLIGLPQSPSRYNPFRHPERARARQGRVLDALVAAGVLSAGRRAHLAALDVAVAPPRPRFRAPHLVEALRPALGAERPPGAGSPLRAVRTTLDPRLQAEVEALARGHQRQLAALGLGNLAAVVLDNHTGDVLAYVGSVDFWDARAYGQNDGVRMLRQPGSTLKPFAYALALASGRYTPATLLADLDTQVPEAGGAFSPENYDRRFHGPVPLRQALACSYNVPAIRLARELGPPALLHALRQAGFSSLRRDAGYYGVGLALGNGEVSLLELAAAYAGLARGGQRPLPRFVLHTRTARGDTLSGPAPHAVASGLDPAAVALVTDILSDPEARAPAFGRGGPLELPFPTAVKTGTSKDYRDNWAVGYTPRHTVAVWAGNFDGAPMRWVSGVTGAAPLLNAIFRALGPGGAFGEPAGLVRAYVCPAGGARPGHACPTRRVERFLPGTVPSDTCRVHQRHRLDARTGLLADASTPPEAVEERLFTVYPAEFHPWMRDRGLPLPPPVTQAQLQARRAARAEAAPAYSDALAVLHPAAGTAYQIDPVLRRAYQRLRLKAALYTPHFDVRWVVDGAPLPGPYEEAAWTLAPGPHTFELHAVDAQGRAVRSRPVTIHVRDAHAL